MDWYGTNLSDCRQWAKEKGLPAFRGQQIFDGLYRQRTAEAAIADFSQISALPQDLQAQLNTNTPLQTPCEVTRQVAGDGTIKSLLQLSDGYHVECVSIPAATRHTICVSSQVGCPVGCTFCASGLNGSQRNLTAGEIVFQVLHHHRRRPVTNVVFMGSGEPLFNYRAVLQAIAVMADERGMGLGRRRFTVSTSGVPERMRDLGRDEPQVTLALSLHAPDDATRSQLVPLNRRWPVQELMAAMDDYRQLVNRRITLEYVLLADANMSGAQATALGQLARRYGAHINLIPFNPVSSSPHQRPHWDDVEHFADQVRQAGGHATVRGQRGADIDAACGQLQRRHGQSLPNGERVPEQQA